MADIGEYLYASRRKAGLTQEAASEATGLHVRTIQRYEYGELVCPDDAVWLFAKAYKDPGLCYRALQLGPVYQSILPGYEPSGVPMAALNLMARLRSLEDYANDMITILADGEIDSTEDARWQEITKAVRRLAVACLQVLEAGGGSA